MVNSAKFVSFFPSDIYKRSTFIKYLGHIGLGFKLQPDNVNWKTGIEWLYVVT